MIVKEYSNQVTNHSEVSCKESLPDYLYFMVIRLIFESIHFIH